MGTKIGRDQTNEFRFPYGLNIGAFLHHAGKCSRNDTERFWVKDAHGLIRK
jgi:hypothetical protein